MPDDTLAVLHETYLAVAEALDRLTEWDEPGWRPTQYACDLLADEAAFAVLDSAGYGVISEEREPHGLDRDVVVVVDPVDGTSNAIRGIPYYATSLCAVDRRGPRAALVVNLATGAQFEAVRGEGARCDGLPLHVGGCTSLSDADVVLSGLPREDAPWRSMRAFGATALELCDVAQGLFDAYVNTDWDVTAPWDYLGGLLVCLEAGAAATDALGRSLVTVQHDQRRIPLVAATRPLLAEVKSYAWPQPHVTPVAAARRWSAARGIRRAAGGFG